MAGLLQEQLTCSTADDSRCLHVSCGLLHERGPESLYDIARDASAFKRAAPPFLLRHCAMLAASAGMQS